MATGAVPEGGHELDSIRIPQRIVDGDFAGWLRDAMNARHMSARMVGLRTGINHSTITRLLYGYREPTLATTIALLRLFGDGETDQPLTNGRAAGTKPPPESISSR
jgi:transcriptional regulator with XRE-family HTH domain